MTSVRTFRTSKNGEDSEDCQDSIYPPPSAVNDSENRFFAVSDGTTTSFFSRLWSEILTGLFAKNPEQTFSDWETWLSDAQSEWRKSVEERARASDASFFTRNGFLARRPAAATFVALALGETSESGTHWRARVLGDSCIFFLPNNGQPRVLDLKTSAEFSSVVKTVESWSKDDPHRPTERASTPVGDEPPILEHDTVLIASDAFSKWLLLRHERGRPVWGTVLALNDHSEFLGLIAMARAEAEDSLENDDVALAVLKFGDAHSIYREQRFIPNPAPLPILPPEEHPLVGGLPRQDAAYEPESRSVQTIRRSGFARFTLPIALSALSLAGLLWLGISRNRALDQVRNSENERQRVAAELKKAADENGRVGGRAERLQADLEAARRQIEATEHQAQKEAKLRREIQDQVKVFEIGQKNDRQKIAELQEQIAVLKEQLAKPGQAPSPGEAASPPSK